METEFANEFVEIKVEPELFETVDPLLDEANGQTPLFEASYVETDNKTLKYKCPMCNKKYKTIEKVQWHVNTHITFHSVATNGSFKCLECNCYSEEAESFQEHLKTHKKTRGRPKKGSVISCDSIKLFVCDQCGKRFKRKQELFNHGLVHRDLKVYECSQCTKSFKLKQQLQNHLKVHIDIRPFVCIICGKSFKFKQQLENHAKSHSDLRPFPCNFCEKWFKFKQQVQIHLKTHDDFRPYSCEFCNKTFKLKQQLQIHNRVHSDERPFQCSMCGKSFKFKQQLQKHSQVHLKTHDDFRPYSCEFCKKKFKLKQQLQIHNKVHSNERPFQCSTCEKSFKFKQQLQKHSQVHEKKMKINLESVENDLTQHSEENLDENCDVDLEDLIPEMELIGEKNTSNGELDSLNKDEDMEQNDAEKILNVDVVRSDVNTDRREVNIDLIPKIELNDDSSEDSSCRISETVHESDFPIAESGKISDKNLSGEMTGQKASKDIREVNIDPSDVELRNDDSSCRISDKINTPIFENAVISDKNLGDEMMGQRISKDRDEVNVEDLIPEVELEDDLPDLISEVELTNKISSGSLSEIVEKIDTPIFENGELNDKNLCGEIMGQKTDKDRRDVNVEDIIPKLDLRNGSLIEDSRCKPLEIVEQNDISVSENSIINDPSISGVIGKAKADCSERT